MIKRLAVLILCSVLFWVNGQATDREDCVSMLRRVTAEEDTATSLYTDSTAAIWLNLGQHKAVKVGQYIPKHYDLFHNMDSADYALPSDFKAIQGLLVKKNTEWVRSFPNPFFILDTNVYQYFVGWKDQDSARLYLKGDNLLNDDTVRVFYLARAVDMDTGGAVCTVPGDLIPYVIDEAVQYYERYKRRFDVAGQVYQQSRTDMGIIKQSGQ